MQPPSFDQSHLLGIEPLRPHEITAILDLAEDYVALNRQTEKHSEALAGLTQINMFVSSRAQIELGVNPGHPDNNEFLKIFGRA